MNLFLAKINGEGQLKGTEHRCKVLGLSIMNQLSHSFVHDGVKERKIMPADLATKQILEYMTVQVEWTDLVL